MADSSSFVGVVAERVAALRERIAARADRDVTIVAVTKRFGPEAVMAAADAGVVDIGENYAQELAAKASAVAEAGVAPRWHFVGHLQRNKVRSIASTVHLWQTVDSERLGAEIAKRAPGAAVLVQVNAANTAGQSGVALAEVPTLVGTLGDLGLDVRGLMVIGVPGDPGGSFAVFSQVRAMADSLALAECSMGMTDDLEPAIDAGSTMVRVGTALFGPRPD